MSHIRKFTEDQIQSTINSDKRVQNLSDFRLYYPEMYRTYIRSKYDIIFPDPDPDSEISKDKILDFIKETDMTFIEFRETYRYIFNYAINKYHISPLDFKEDDQYSIEEINSFIRNNKILSLFDIFIKNKEIFKFVMINRKASKLNIVDNNGFNIDQIQKIINFYEEIKSPMDLRDLFLPLYKTSCKNKFLSKLNFDRRILPTAEPKSREDLQRIIDEDPEVFCSTDFKRLHYQEYLYSIVHKIKLSYSKPKLRNYQDLGLNDRTEEDIQTFIDNHPEIKNVTLCKLLYSGIYKTITKNGYRIRFPETYSSTLEAIISDYLKNNNINYEQRCRKLDWLVNISTGNNLELDFYIPEFKIGIECQGIQHFTNNFKHSKRIFDCSEDKFNSLVMRDKIKLDLCRKNNITLLYFADYKTMMETSSYLVNSSVDIKNLLDSYELGVVYQDIDSLDKAIKNIIK